MGLIWALGAVALALVLFFAGARAVGGGRRVTAGRDSAEGVQGRDLGANVNPSQHGNEVDLWPDRTGPRTRQELGARQVADVSFTGGREEKKGAEAGVRREVADGSFEPQRAEGSSQQATKADLAPEDAYGEDRPANRTVPPDQPPTQWHPRDHGVPGDHIVDGHHRSATGPERHSTATDPYAHAPVPGPNHIPPPDGVSFPDDIRP